MTRTTLLFAFLFAFLFTLALSQVYSRTVRYGVRTPDDQRVSYMELISPDHPGPGFHLGAEHYNRTVRTVNDTIITQVVIENRGSPCGRVKPVSGGPGFSFVVLRILAPMDCLLDYVFELYGNSGLSVQEE